MKLPNPWRNTPRRVYVSVEGRSRRKGADRMYGV
jgi:hypothetical protein